MRARPFATLAGCLTVAAGLAISPIAAATADGAAGTPVGGPLLGSRGVVEQPLPGAPTLPPESSLPASAWMVTNLTTGQVLAAKDPHGRFLPASTLKTLTAATLLPRLDPHSTFMATVRDETVDGTRVGLVAGSRYSISKLFTCLLVVSANDAADALAQANGGVRHTVAQMNTVAHRLQAYDTHADTPSGLDGPGETTSAYDLALIAKADYAMPAFRHYVQTIRSRVPAPHHKHFMIYTHNDLLTTFKGDIGGKNGYTVAAHATYVGAATRRGQTILVTLLHANPIWWPMASELLDWGFKANHKVTPVGTLVSPLLPSSAATKTVSHNVPAAAGTAAASPAGGTNSAPVLAIVIAIGALAVLAFSGAAFRRRQQRRRRYRPRLKLPPH